MLESVAARVLLIVGVFNALSAFVGGGTQLVALGLFRRRVLGQASRPE